MDSRPTGGRLKSPKLALISSMGVPGPSEEESSEESSSSSEYSLSSLSSYSVSFVDIVLNEEIDPSRSAGALFISLSILNAGPISTSSRE